MVPPEAPAQDGSVEAPRPGDIGANEHQAHIPGGLPPRPAVALVAVGAVDEQGQPLVVLSSGPAPSVRSGLRAGDAASGLVDGADGGAHVGDPVVGHDGSDRGVLQEAHGHGGVQGVVAHLPLVDHPLRLPGEQRSEERHGSVGVCDPQMNHDETTLVLP